MGPCKEVHKLTRSVARWGGKWSIPCGDRIEREPVFYNKVNNWMWRLADAMQRRAKCDD